MIRLHVIKSSSVMSTRAPFPNSPLSPVQRYVAWLVGGAGAAALVAWVAARLTLAGIAPLGILPIAVGGTLGGGLAWLAGRLRVAGRKRLLAGAACCAAVAILAEHAWLYHDFRREWVAARTNDPRVAWFRSESPWSPVEYLGHELARTNGTFWAFDGVLVLAATVATVALATRNSSAMDRG